MREKLLYEGWVYDEHFPEMWLIKKWEGKKRSKTGKRNQDLKFITSEGKRLESFKTFYEHMQINNDGDDTINKAKQFKEEWSISVRRGGFEWEDGGITLPEGWKKRRGQGKTESESILSPEGIQFRSRYNALMHLYKDNGEGVISNGSFSTNTVYLSSEGHVFESNKTAIDFMASNKKSYKKDNIENIKEFQVKAF